MNACPDWNRLVARRDAGTATALQSWERALHHLEGCPDCQRDALAADPVLVFQRLGSLELSPEAERAEVEENRRVVAALRTGRRLEGRAQGAGHSAALRRWSAAAVLAIATLSMTGRLSQAVRPAVLAGVRPAPVAADRAALPAAPSVLMSESSATAITAVEGLDRPKARVYQLRGNHLSVVMIVDEKLNV